MSIDVGGNQKTETLDDMIVGALDLKGTLDVVELVTIVREAPSLVEARLESLLASRRVEVVEEEDGLKVYRLKSPLHGGFYRRSD